MKNIGNIKPKEYLLTLLLYINIQQIGDVSVFPINTEERIKYEVKKKLWISI